MGQAEPAQRLPGWMVLALGGLVAYRIVYHCAYLVRVPFALATFSDGLQYEDAAIDILTSPPLGNDPFYLQGLYAYFMAAMLAIRPWMSLPLLAQLCLAALALWAFFRAGTYWLGRRRAGIAMIVLLASPAVAFYENKFLTAELAVATTIGVLWALARAQARPTALRLGVVGAAVGLAVLARPNVLVAVPCVAWGLVCLAKGADQRIRRVLGPAAVGLVVVLTPMSARNLLVTGSPTFLPAHGGGTSFYIGNNAHARGVWNDAGGLISGRVATERGELADQLGVHDSRPGVQAAEIGRRLYARAWDEITDDPGRWLWLEVRKVWLLIGNDELTQDYDWHGEQEMIPWAHRIGAPFGLVLALGVSGALAIRRRIVVAPESPQATKLRPLAWTLVGLAAAVVAANVLYFTSSQHRVPLTVVLALLTGWGAPALVDAVRTVVSRKKEWRAAGTELGLAIFIVVAASVPRAKQREPTAVHYYNLAVVYTQLGEYPDALQQLDRAVKRRPDHPLLMFERAIMRRRLGDFAGARRDLETLKRLGPLPPWLRRPVAAEHEMLELLEHSAEAAKSQ